MIKLAEEVIWKIGTNKQIITRLMWLSACSDIVWPRSVLKISPLFGILQFLMPRNRNSFVADFPNHIHFLSYNQGDGRGGTKFTLKHFQDECAGNWTRSSWLICSPLGQWNGQSWRYPEKNARYLLCPWPKYCINFNNNNNNNIPKFNRVMLLYEWLSSTYRIRIS